MAETIYITHDDDGIRLDRWFKRHYPALTHGRLEKLLRTGQVRLDGKRVKAGDRVGNGQALSLPPHLGEADPESKQAPTPRDGEARMLQELILHMDNSVIVLNKPAGLATQG